MPKTTREEFDAACKRDPVADAISELLERVQALEDRECRCPTGPDYCYDDDGPVMFRSSVRTVLGLPPDAEFKDNTFDQIRYLLLRRDRAVARAKQAEERLLACRRCR